MSDIYMTSAVKLEGKWRPRRPRPVTFAGDIPPLRQWLLMEDGVAAYFAPKGEKPSPLLPDNPVMPVLADGIKITGTGCASCQKKRSKAPDDTCWECAEKHLGTAYALYAREHGYRNLNRWHYLGELNNAANHLDDAVPEYAEKIRALRHGIQQDITIPDSRWEELSAEFYQLMSTKKGN